MYQQTACCSLLSARRTARNDTFAAGEGTIESRGGSGGGPGEGCTASRKHLASDIAPGCTSTVPVNCLVPPALGSCCLGGGAGVPPGLLAARQLGNRAADVAAVAPRRALGSPAIPVPRHATPQRRLLKRVARMHRGSLHVN